MPTDDGRDPWRCLHDEAVRTSSRRSVGLPAAATGTKSKSVTPGSDLVTDLRISGIRDVPRRTLDQGPRSRETPDGGDARDA